MNSAGPLVLVVDDDPTARRMLDVRMRALGCQVAMAETGREALAAIERDLPAVICSISRCRRWTAWKSSGP
jgi:CheY-like chemotaxis protein